MSSPCAQLSRDRRAGSVYGPISNGAPDLLSHRRQKDGCRAAWEAAPTGQGPRRRRLGPTRTAPTTPLSPKAILGGTDPTGGARPRLCRKGRTPCYRNKTSDVGAREVRETNKSSSQSTHRLRAQKNLGASGFTARPAPAGGPRLTPGLATLTGPSAPGGSRDTNPDSWPDLRGKCGSVPSDPQSTPTSPGPSPRRTNSNGRGPDSRSRRREDGRNEDRMGALIKFVLVTKRSTGVTGWRWSFVQGPHT